MSDTYKYETSSILNIGLSELSLASCTAAYYGNDIEYIIDYISQKFSESYVIPIVPTRFFTNFIDSQSNCYTNKFERIIDGKDIKLIDFGKYLEIQH